MHDYLRAIGFSKYNTKKKLVRLLSKLLQLQEDFHKKAVKLENGQILAEIRAYYGDHIGINWYGTLQMPCDFDFDFFIPFVEPDLPPTESEHLTVIKKKDGPSCVGSCEDYRMNMSLVFQVLNSAYSLKLAKKDLHYTDSTVAFSALSIEGSILLPVAKSMEDIEKNKQETVLRRELITAARNGDENAVEALTFDDMETYMQLSNRIQNEDILSIVDSTFMPHSYEHDLYSVVCDIADVRLDTNVMTGEQIYELDIVFNDIHFRVGINKEDLVGEPLPGRRFKGIIWLLGTVVNPGTPCKE